MKEIRSGEMKILRPLKAIRVKCLDCCGGSANEVKLCEIENCPLFPYRFGKKQVFREKTLIFKQDKKKSSAVRRGVATKVSFIKKSNAGAGFEEKKAIPQTITDHHGE